MKIKIGLFLSVVTLFCTDIFANELCSFAAGNARLQAIGQCHFSCLWMTMAQKDFQQTSEFRQATQRLEGNRNALADAVNSPSVIENRIVEQFNALKRDWSANEARCRSTILPDFALSSAHRYTGALMSAATNGLFNSDCARYRRGVIEVRIGNMSFAFQIPPSTGESFDPRRDFGSRGTSEAQVRAKIQEFMENLKKDSQLCDIAHTLALRAPNADALLRQPTDILNQLFRNTSVSAETINSLEAYRCSERQDAGCPSQIIGATAAHYVVDFIYSGTFGGVDYNQPRSIRRYNPRQTGGRQ